MVDALAKNQQRKRRFQVKFDCLSAWGMSKVLQNKCKILKEIKSPDSNLEAKCRIYQIFNVTKKRENIKEVSNERYPENSVLNGEPARI